MIAYTLQMGWDHNLIIDLTRKNQLNNELFFHLKQLVVVGVVF